MKKKLKRKDSEIPLCLCGCGHPVERSKIPPYNWNKYILGHNKRSRNSASSNNGRFQPGNTQGKGRPQGSRNSASIAIASTIQGERDRLTRKCIELGLAGNVPCLKICIERLSPIAKSSPIKLKGFPRVDSIESAGRASEFLLRSVSTGKVSPLDAEILSRILDKRIQSLQISDIESQIKEIKEALAQ